jgi:tubulin-specific chaperone D
LKYQEASYVLDPLIGDMVEPIMKLMQIYTKAACSAGMYGVPKEISLLFEILYNLCNVRGFKTIVKFFPHEAADMEPCVELLHF